MKIILAYSGGLDTTVLIPWLKQKYQAQIIAYCANIGQQEELKNLKQKARATGAHKTHIENLQETFATHYIYPMLQSGALYENQYHLGTAIARPLIAQRMIQIAQQEKAQAIAHGATGKGNDQIRFELTAAALAPHIQTIAPWRDPQFRAQFPGRNQLIQYCRKNNIPIQHTAKNPYSTDRNLLHISHEAGPLEDPWLDPTTPKHKHMYKLTTAPEDAPDKPQHITLTYQHGNCTHINNKPKKPHQIIQHLNQLGGKHAIGRLDLVENRAIGIKSRGIYETPGGTILHYAHQQIQTLTLDRPTLQLLHNLAPQYAQLIYDGLWHSPERQAIQTLITQTQQNVTGTIRLKLYKGNTILTGRKSTHSLYNPQLATMDEDPTSAYNQDDATGYIRLNALRLKTAAQLKQQQKTKPKPKKPTNKKTTT